MSPQVLWVLCFSGWHTSYCNMTMEPPWINQFLFCLETGALENGPDSYTLDPDWSRSGSLLHLAGATSFYSFKRTNLIFCVCACGYICLQGFRQTYTGVLRRGILNMKMQKVDLVCILVSFCSSVLHILTNVIPLKLHDTIQKLDFRVGC